MQWRVTNLGDGYCTIQSLADLRGLYYENGSVKLGNMSATIADKYKWKISSFINDTVLIQPKGSTQYVADPTTYINSSSTVSLSNMTTSGSSTSPTIMWQAFDADDYVEPNNTMTFQTLTMDIGDVKAPTISNPDGCTLSDASDFYYLFVTGAGCATVNQNTGKFTGVTSGTAMIQAFHKTTGIAYFGGVKVNKNAIIIVPGIMGSKLKTTEAYGQNQAGDTVWPPMELPLFDSENIDYNVMVVEKINALKFNNDGTPQCSTIALDWSSDDGRGNETNAYDASIHFGALNTYESLNKHLYDNYIDLYDVIFFQYDWRYSNIVSAQALNTFINANQYDNVILIAHSMGGLVAANYLSLGTAQQNKVRKLITLGTPFFGSIDMVEYFQLCNNASDLLELTSIILGRDPLLSNFSKYVNTATDVLHNIPSLYELFPNQQYFSVAGKYYLKTADPLSLQVNNITTYAETKEKLISKLDGFNTTLMSSAESVHASLYTNGNYITNTVDSYYVVGTNINTSKYITLDSSLIYTVSSTTKTACGDGTVASWSANLGGLYPTRTYSMSGYSHADGLIKSTNIFNLIDTLI